MQKRVLGGVLLVLFVVGVFLLADSAGPAGAPLPAPLSSAAIYRLQVRVYLTPAQIVMAQDLPSASLDPIIGVLERLEPPAELLAIHQDVLAGYRFIREGRQIMETTPPSDGAQRAEGEFLISWGVRGLLEAAQQLARE